MTHQSPDHPITGLSVRAWLEAIADVPNGPDEGWRVRIRLDLGAQRGDAAIDTSRRDEHRMAPHRIEDVVARQRAALAGGKVGEELELLGGQFDLRAVAKQLARGQIELVAAESADRRGSRLPPFTTGPRPISFRPTFPVPSSRQSA